TKNTLSAMLLATRGKQFTEIETALNFYYFALRECEKIKSGKKTVTQEMMEGEQVWPQKIINKNNKELQKGVLDQASELCKIFMDAIESKDSKKIFEIANAVEFLKKFKELGEESDYYRGAILFLKEMLDT